MAPSTPPLATEHRREPYVAHSELTPGRARPLPVHFVLGAAALVTSHTLLLLHIEPIYTYFFSFAWWPYILWVDGWVYWRTGESLLVTHPRAFLAAAFWSVACWCLYEAFNFRLQNWYYVMTPAPAWAYRLNYAAGFATVFPGLFETAALLSSFGVFQHRRTPPFPVTPRVLRTVFTGGVLATLLPLVWPLLFFPLIWVSMALLFEPLVYRGRGHSLLAELGRGEPRRLATLLTAGAINGGLWEGWNALTRTGWIYTVPWADWVHVFEMPLAGYLGFPLLAVECAVLWSVLDLRRLTGAANATNTGSRSVFRHGRTPVGVVAALVWVMLVFAGVDRWTSSSHHTELATLPGISQLEVAACAAAGLRYPYALLHAVNRRGLERIANELRLPTARVRALYDASQLSEFRGIGVRNLRLLQAAGITRIEELAGRESSSLAARLRQLGEAQALRPPYQRQVRGWIEAARRWKERRH